MNEEALVINPVLLARAEREFDKRFPPKSAAPREPNRKGPGAWEKGQGVWDKNKGDWQSKRKWEHGKGSHAKKGRW